MIISFSPQAVNENLETRTARCVVDLNSYGAVIGVEIMNLSELTNAATIDFMKPTITDSGPGLRCSYDVETDMFYVRLSNERSVNQESRNCRFVKGNDGRLILIEVDPTA